MVAACAAIKPILKKFMVMISPEAVRISSWSQ
jgi:hypothetical protein